MNIKGSLRKKSKNWKFKKWKGKRKRSSKSQKHKSLKLKTLKSNNPWRIYAYPEEINIEDIKIESELGNRDTINAYPRLVFPFVSIENFRSKSLQNTYNPEGTGFFIHENGLFVTAKHVPNFREEILNTFIAIHTHKSLISVRHVHQFVYHEEADICVGFLDKHDPKNKLIYDENIKFQHLIPCFEVPNQGDIVTNFGYGGSSIEDINEKSQMGNFTCQWGEGPITEIYLDGRDRSALPGATIEAQLPTIGKASGGPVFNSKGEVIGVNSRSLDGEPPISYFTPINQILELELTTEKYGKIKIKEFFE